jgi:adenine-specific DNA-methyltransferase
MNDILKHNSLAHETFLLHMHYSREDLSELLNEMEQTKPVYGYTTRTFGGRYFSRENAMRLDAWLDFAHDGRLPSLVRSALLTSVIYAADKVALTVGHYDAFLKGARSSTSAKLLMPESIGVGTGHTVLNEDANVVVGQVETEVLYLDPPYNSRQYSDTYHVLENLACWQKPDVYGVSRKMDRTHLKSPYSGRRAGEAFAALVEDAKADLIVLSYSNTGNSRIARSNNVLSDRDIMKVLNSRGRVRVETLSHREFSAGKTSARDHAERLFICRVGQK